MKIKLLLVIVCWMAFGLGALAQRLNNSYSRDTVLKDGNIVVSENIRTELQKIPIPAGANAPLHFYKKILNAALHQNEISVSRLQMNWFFQFENQIRLYRFNNKHNVWVWNPSVQTRYEKSNMITYVMILLIIFNFFAGRQPNIKVSELFVIVFFSVIIGIVSPALFIMFNHYYTETSGGVIGYEPGPLSFMLSVIGLAFLSALAIFSGRAFSRKKETEESLMIGIG